MEQKYKRKRFDKGTFTKRKGEKDKYNVIYDQKTFRIHVSFLKATLLREDISRHCENKERHWSSKVADMDCSSTLHTVRILVGHQ
jgi:hypothetical protein